MAQATRKDLVQAAEDLNKVLLLDPAIDTGLKVDDLRTKIMEGSALVTPEDVLAEVTQKVLESLAPPPAKVSRAAAPAPAKEEKQLKAVKTETTEKTGRKIPAREGSFSQRMDNALLKGGKLTAIADHLSLGDLPSSIKDGKVMSVLKNHLRFREKDEKRFNVTRTGEGDEQHVLMTEKKVETA